MTHANTNLHIAVTALTGNVEHNTGIGQVQFIHTFGSFCLLLGGSAGQNAAKVQVFGAVILYGRTDQIEHCQTCLVDTAVDSSGCNGSAGNGINAASQRDRNGLTLILLGKSSVLCFRAQTGSFGKLAAAHADTGDGLIQIHTNGNLNGTAEAGNRDLCHITHRLTAGQCGVAGIQAAGSIHFHLFEGIGSSEADLTGSICLFNCPLGNGTFCERVYHAQCSADHNTDQQQD